MGRNYKQITLAERCQITQLLAAGFKIREIAAALDRAPSTIARELKRNGSRTKGYEPSYAQQQARARRLEWLPVGAGSGAAGGGADSPGLRRGRFQHHAAME